MKFACVQDVPKLRDFCLRRVACFKFLDFFFFAPRLHSSRNILVVHGCNVMHVFSFFQSEPSEGSPHSQVST